MMYTKLALLQVLLLPGALVDKMEIANATEDIKAALRKLGYKLDGHRICVMRIIADLFEVRYDYQYFGVWDASRKTFID